MRIRYNPQARPELAAWEYYIDEPERLRGRWAQQFARPQPMALELGCGKGGFMAQMAPAHPETNFIALDIKSEMLVLAKRKAEEAYAAAGRPMDNLLMTAVDIERIFLIMDENDRFGEIYINFCPPCPKCRQHKHRLTHPRQLLQYRTLMPEGAEIYFKTDDDDLFRDSVGYFPAAGFEITWQTCDLHREEPAWNIRTEHEGMFSEQGIPIKALIARKGPDSTVTWVEPKARARAAEEDGNA